MLFTVCEAANAFKATLPRTGPAGDIGATDVYGAQQQAPLLDVDIPDLHSVSPAGTSKTG